jgi:hypothetical protein
MYCTHVRDTPRQTHHRLQITHTQLPYSPISIVRIFLLVEFIALKYTILKMTYVYALPSTTTNFISLKFWNYVQ